MEALGLNLFNIIIYIILFVLVYILLNKFLIKKLVDVIDKRKDDLEKFNKDTESLAVEAQDLEAKKAGLASEMKKENSNKLNAVMLEAKKEKEKILDAARKESSEIIEQGRKKALQEEEKMKKEMEDKVAVAAKKVVREVYGIDKDSIDKSLVNKAIKELS